MADPTVTISIYNAGRDARGIHIEWKSCNQHDMDLVVANLIHQRAAQMATGDKDHYTAGDYEAALKRLLEGARIVREAQDSKPDRQN